jgi:hypothetical protein
MKKTIVASVMGVIASAAMVGSSYGQGQIQFLSYGLNTDAIVTRGGVPVLGSDGYMAALYFALGTVSEPSASDPTGVPSVLQLVAGSTTPFFNAPLAGYFQGSAVTIPGFTSGLVTFEVVAWTGGNSYGDPANTFRGHSSVFQSDQVVALGLPVKEFGAGLQVFSVNVVPEPSTIALIGLGTGALLFFRRRK